MKASDLFSFSIPNGYQDDSASRSSSARHLKTNRPKSTPANKFRVTYAEHISNRRPKTASLVGRDCHRLESVERETTRQHKFKSTLPVRKDKPAPWQAQLELERLSHTEANISIADGSQKPVHVAPGYILSRSKAKYQMFINDKFFEQQKADSQHNEAPPDPEVEQLITTLKEQVSDLSLYLEEERMNHKDTKRRSEQYLDDRVEDIRRDHKEAMRRVVDEHEQTLDGTIHDYETQLSNQKDSYEVLIARYKTEVEFLQGAFESYKSQNHREHQASLKELKEELKESHHSDMQAHLKDLGIKMTNDKNAALASSNREHTKLMTSQEKQFKKELENLNRRYSNHAADVKKLKLAEARIQELVDKCDELIRMNETTDKELVNVKRDSAEYKAKLTIFERDFEEKVAEIDNSYKLMLSDLREQNTQLRTRYMKKCDELFALVAKTDRDKLDQVKTQKDTMKALIQSRCNAKVSVAAQDPNIKKLVAKNRPCSAPSTRQEERVAATSAGETDHILAAREPEFVRPQSVLDISAVFDSRELDNLTDEELEEGLLVQQW